MNEITRLYNKLESEYPDGGYVSRSTIFSYALDDGKISKETYREAMVDCGIIQGTDKLHKGTHSSHIRLHSITGYYNPHITQFTHTPKTAKNSQLNP